MPLSKVFVFIVLWYFLCGFKGLIFKHKQLFNLNDFHHVLPLSDHLLELTSDLDFFDPVFGECDLPYLPAVFKTLLDGEAGQSQCSNDVLKQFSLFWKQRSNYFPNFRVA